jgi:hypothetical protein
MGFMDKAKKMAEQAQAKLDEVQKSVNTTQGGPPAGGGPVVEYDKHGRPIQPAPVVPDTGAPDMATPGVPQTEPPAAPASVGPPGSASTAPTPDPSAPAPRPPAPPAAPAAAAAPGGPPAPEDRNRPSTEAPKLSSGDPLAG